MLPCMSSTWENHADVDIKNISRHISTCYSNQMVLGNTWKTTKSCQTFQEIRLLQYFAGHLLYYGCNVHCTSSFVVYPGSFNLLWVLMNQSFQSPHPEVGMVSLLYDSAMEQLSIFVQNFKSYYMSTCWDFFTDMSTWKKISTTALEWRQLCTLNARFLPDLVTQLQILNSKKTKTKKKKTKEKVIKKFYSYNLCQK